MDEWQRWRKKSAPAVPPDGPVVRRELAELVYQELNQGTVEYTESRQRYREAQQALALLELQRATLTRLISLTVPGPWHPDEYRLP